MTAATTIPSRIRKMVPGTVPVGTNLRGFGRVVQVSLTAYLVRSAYGQAWLPFKHVHDMEPVVGLVTFADGSSYGGAK